MGSWRTSNPLSARGKKRKDFILLGLVGGAGILALAGIGLASQGGSPSVRGKVFVDGSDSTEDYLFPKLSAGSGVTLTVLNPGGNEQVQISSTGGGTVGPGTPNVLSKFITATTIGDSPVKHVAADPSVSPTSDAAVDLGDPSFRWRKLYVGNGYVSDHADGAQGGVPAEIAINSPAGGSGMSVGLNVGGDLDINASAGRVALISGPIDVFTDGAGNAMYPAPGDSVGLGGVGASQHWGIFRVRGSSGFIGYAVNSTSQEWLLNTGTGLGLYANAGDSEFAANLINGGGNGALRFGPGGVTPPDVFVERNSGNLRFFAGSNRIQWSGSAFGPSTVDATFDLGTTSLVWRAVYATKFLLGVGGGGFVGFDLDSNGQIEIVGCADIRPSGDMCSDFGSDVKRVDAFIGPNWRNTGTSPSGLTMVSSSFSLLLDDPGFTFRSDTFHGGTVDLGSRAVPWQSLYLMGASLHVLGAASDANDTATLKSGELDFGPGGTLATDTYLKRIVPGKLETQMLRPDTSNAYDLGQNSVAQTAFLWRKGWINSVAQPGAITSPSFVSVATLATTVGTSGQITMSVTKGKFILMSVGSLDTTTTSSITDSDGNTWANIRNVNNTGRIEQWGAFIGKTNASLIITVTKSSSTTFQAIAAQYNNVSGTGRSSGSTGTAVAVVVGATGAAGHPGSLVVSSEVITTSNANLVPFPTQTQRSQLTGTITTLVDDVSSISGNNNVTIGWHTTDASTFTMAENFVELIGTGVGIEGTQSGASILFPLSETLLPGSNYLQDLGSSGAYWRDVFAYRTLQVGLSQHGATPVLFSAANKSAGVTSAAPTFTLAVRKNQFIVVAAGWNDASVTISSVTDTAGNAYTQRTHNSTGVNTANSLDVWTARALTTATVTVTITFSASTFSTLDALVYDNVSAVGATGTGNFVPTGVGTLAITPQAVNSVLLFSAYDNLQTQVAWKPPLLQETPPFDSARRTAEGDVFLTSVSAFTGTVFFQDDTANARNSLINGMELKAFAAPADFQSWFAHNAGPQQDNLFDLGSGSIRFANVFATTMVAGSSSFPLTMTGTSVVAGNNPLTLGTTDPAVSRDIIMNPAFNGAVRPAFDNNNDLGTTSLRWRSAYLGTMLHINRPSGTQVMDFKTTSARTSTMELVDGAFYYIAGAAGNDPFCVQNTDLRIQSARALYLEAGIFDANPTAKLIGQQLELGVGGATATDVIFSRIGAGTIRFTLSGTSKLEADVNQLYPGGDAYGLGTAGHRWSTGFFSVGVKVLAAASDANPTAFVTGAEIDFGPGGATATDSKIARTGSGDITITPATGGFNLILGSGFFVPQSDNIADLGTSSKRWRDLYIGGVFKRYNGITPVAFGVPLIVGEGDLTGQTGTVASVAAYTVGAANGVFKVGGDIDVTAFTSGTINLQVTYTDWNSSAQTVTIDSVALLADAPGNEVTIMAKASTSITIKTTGTFTATYSVAATIIQVK